MGNKEDSGNKKNLFKYIVDSYGNTRDLISSSSYLLNFLPRDKAYTKAIKKIIPAAIFVSDIYSKVQEFKHKDEDIDTRRITRMANVMGCSAEDVCQLDEQMKIGEQICEWLVNGPNFKHGITHEKSLTVDSLYGKNEKNTMVILRYKGKLFVYEISKIKGLNGYIYAIDYSAVDCYDYVAVAEFRSTLHGNFLASLDTKKNAVIYTKDSQIDIRKRSSEIDYNIQQLDVKRIAKEIKITLDNGLKRAYALVGVPGTGKTSSILCIENNITEYPVIYTDSRVLNKESRIDTFFSFINTIGRCIVVMEDMDGYGYDGKSEELTLLLNHIDNMKDRLKVVYICTFNSTNVHSSLIRRGRIDEVIDILRPTNNKHVYEIMSAKYKSLTNKELELRIPWIVYNRIKRYKFTQSDICEIINKAWLIDSNISINNIKTAINDIIDSMKIIKKYK